MFSELNLPAYPFRVKQASDGSYQIFDEFRKKFLALTAEEWVRQHLLQYLTNYLQFPKGLLKIETGLKLNTLQKRTDALFYKDRLPFVLIECKAPDVVIDNATFEQIGNYNIVHKAKYLIVSNGLQHYCCKIDFDKGAFNFLPEIPAYNDL